MSLHIQQLTVLFCIILLMAPLNMARSLREKRDTSQPITGGFNVANVIYGAGAFDLSSFTAGGTGPVGDGTIIVAQNGIFIKTGTYYNAAAFQQLVLLVQQLVDTTS